MEQFKLRPPAVAGTFYPSHPGELREQVQSYLNPVAAKTSARGCILPHAGYVYSGKVAGLTVSEIRVRDRVILFGPNHTGYGPSISMVNRGQWETPLGPVDIDVELADMIIAASTYIEADTLAHAYEHSLEVELPFLQYFNEKIRIVPAAFMSQDLDVVRKTGKEIALVLLQHHLADQVLLVASSDMTHYESEHEARRKDTAAIQAIRKLDEEALFETVEKLNISMCGYVAVAAMIVCAKELGASSARLVSYQTSGDVTGDRTSVVGYAGMVIE